jgi:hypothetical protein
MSREGESAAKSELLWRWLTSNAPSNRLRHQIRTFGDDQHTAGLAALWDFSRIY